MQLALQPFRVVWKILFLVYFACAMLVFYPIMNYLLDKPKRYPSAFRFMRMWAWWLLGIPGIRVKVVESAPLPEGPFIICPNHSSYLDILAMYRVFSNYFIFMGKAELLNWPLFHIFFSKGMNISVDRKSNLDAHLAFTRAKKELSMGHSIVIFPEGTIPHEAPRLKAFKNGAFKLSLETGIPIVPVTFLDNWKRLQAGPVLRRKGGPGLSRAIIHAPVFPANYGEAGMTQMRNDVMRIIEKPIIEAYGN